ncbi:hypothetical protein HRbin37_00772 [bacterium HR37]|nr:hypothetical protein HRbin37_00772 [bacterium HR37]
MLKGKVSFAVFLGFFLFPSLSYGAHILEPLETEITSTPPRGQFFLQVLYGFLRTENGERVDEHFLPIEIEFGLGLKTQLNLEAETLIAEKENGHTEERGVEEVAIGIKHRFLDESDFIPEMAFEIEFAPVTELGDGQAVSGTLIFSKFIGRWFVVHANLGYGFERKEDGEKEFVNTVFYRAAVAFRAVPDRFFLIAELTSEHMFIEDGPTVDRVIVIPESILVPFERKPLAVKFGFPLGITDGSETPDFGVVGGVSVLF